MPTPQNLTTPCIDLLPTANPTTSSTCSLLAQWIDHIFVSSTAPEADIIELQHQLIGAPLFFLETASIGSNQVAHLPIVGIAYRSKSPTGEHEHCSNPNHPLPPNLYGTFLLLDAQPQAPIVYDLRKTYAHRISLFCPQKSLTVPFPTGLLRHLTIDEKTCIPLPVWPDNLSVLNRDFNPRISVEAAQRHAALHDPLLDLLLPPAEIECLRNSPLTIRARIDTLTTATGSKIELCVELRLTIPTAPAPLVFPLFMRYAVSASNSNSNFSTEMLRSFFRHYAQTYRLRQVIESVGFSTDHTRMSPVSTANHRFYWQWPTQKRILVATIANPYPAPDVLLIYDSPLLLNETPSEAMTRINNLLGQVRILLAEYSATQLQC